MEKLIGHRSVHAEPSYLKKLKFINPEEKRLGC